MRCLGEIEGQKSAELFVAHLLTIDIPTQIESTSGRSDTWELWVREEDQLEKARAELADFRANPTDARFHGALARASQLLEEREKARRIAAKNVRRLEPGARTTMLGRGPLPPLTLTLFILSLAVGLFSNFSQPGPNNELGRTIVDSLSFASSRDLMATANDPAASLKAGQIWRVITPIFLHIGPIHLAMNMFMLLSFGRLVERWVGTPTYALMVLILAIVPNLVQGLSPEWMHGNVHFGGISGVLYGLFGYVLLRTSMNPNHGISIPFPMVVLLVGLIVIGLSGVIENWRMADLCHLGGLLVGSALGFASERAKSAL